MSHPRRGTRDRTGPPTRERVAVRTLPRRDDLRGTHGRSSRRDRCRRRSSQPPARPRAPLGDHRQAVSPGIGARTPGATEERRRRTRGPERQRRRRRPGEAQIADASTCSVGYRSRRCERSSLELRRERRLDDALLSPTPRASRGGPTCAPTGSVACDPSWTLSTSVCTTSAPSWRRCSSTAADPEELLHHSRRPCQSDGVTSRTHR